MEHINLETPEATRNSYRLVTLATAARETGITRKRLRAAVSDGTLPAYQIGAWLRIRLADIDQWLEDRRYPAHDKGMR
jgi:excisionase family DNA binding protein